MNFPLTGISLIVSLIIVGVHVLWVAGAAYLPTLHYPSWLCRDPWAGLLHSFIVAVILLASGVVLSGILMAAFKDTDSTYAFVSNQFISCDPIDQASSTDRLAILRLDDVQAFGWTDISITLMEEALARDMPVVAGTIAKNISSDPVLERFMRTHGCNIEVALHGYSHGTGAIAEPHQLDYGAEFANLNDGEARIRLTEALQELATFTTTPIVSFIPPENRLSTSSRLVLPEFGLRYLSSEGTGPYDYHAASWDFMTQHYLPARTTITDCVRRYQAGETLCVIMLHPQDYAQADGSIDPDLLNDYRQLLDWLQSFAVGVVTFRDLDSIPTLRAR